MSTIKEVAARAGLSVSVVSKYLKAPSTVREDTRQRVEEAIEALDFVPSPAARSLRTGRTGIIVCIYPTIRNVTFNTYIDVLQLLAEKAHLNILLVSEDHLIASLSSSSKESVIKTSPVGGADGVLYCMSKNKEKVRELSRFMKGKAQVSLARSSFILGVPNVSWDNDYAIYMTTKHLIEMGHRNIGYLTTSPADDMPNNRRHGFLRAMHESDLPVLPELYYCYTGMFNNVRGGFIGMEKLMQSPVKPTAVVTDSDFLAMGCSHYAHMHGMSVPEDLALTGLFNAPPAEIFSPPITTVPFPAEQLAKWSMETLLKLLDNKAGAELDIPMDTFFRTEMIVRRSSDITKPLYSIPDMMRVN